MIKCAYTKIKPYLYRTKVVLPIVLTEIICTFNCYINNLAFSIPSKKEKKEIRVENKRTSLYASRK